MTNTQPQVAFYLRMLSGGGAERVIVNLIKELIQKGVKVDLVLNIAEGPFVKQVPSEVRIVSLGTPKLLKGLPKLADYLRREQPLSLISALHYNNEIAIWAKVLSRTSTRVIVSEHNTISVHSKYQTDRERWAPLFAKLLYPWADHILTVSHGAAQDLAKVTGLPISEIKVIYNPVITQELLNKTQEKIEHPWFKPGEPPVIIAVGRLHPQKDYPTLIRSLARVKQVQPCRLMILGQGPNKDQLMALIRELNLTDDISLLGFVENPYAYMKQATLLALSSRNEGLPTVLIEALAVGLPVVATDCPSGPDEILDHGKYGFLVPIGDEQAMAEAILSVLSGNRKSTSSDWLEQFTAKTATQKYLDLIS
ncbi:MAG: glycosyltransferase [Microcystaceae cyanobacterium]